MGNSLAGQPGEFELIVVDDFLGRPERGEAQRFLKQDKGLPLTWYGPSKQKSRPETRSGFCNAVNTGLIHANGEFVVFMSDYTFFRDPIAAFWQQVFYFAKKDGEEKSIFNGVAIEYDAPKPDNPGDVFTYHGPVGFMPKRPWVPSEAETFYLGGPVAFFEMINGMDERADHNITWNVEALLFQVKAAGWKFQIQHQMVMHMIDHRPWDGNFMEGQWRTCGYVASLEKKPEWQAYSPNLFNLAHLRQKAKKTKDQWSL